MAKTIKCKSCKSINDKYSKKCSFCGAVLYPEISRKNAELITIILDIIFSFIYLFAIFLFIKNANNNQTPKYINLLPAANSFPYFLIILLFLCFQFHGVKLQKKSQIRKNLANNLTFRVVILKKTDFHHGSRSKNHFCLDKQ